MEKEFKYENSYDEKEHQSKYNKPKADIKT